MAHRLLTPSFRDMLFDALMVLLDLLSAHTRSNLEIRCFSHFPLMHQWHTLFRKFIALESVRYTGTSHSFFTALATLCPTLNSTFPNTTYSLPEPFFPKMKRLIIDCPDLSIKSLLNYLSVKRERGYTLQYLVLYVNTITDPQFKALKDLVSVLMVSTVG